MFSIYGYINTHILKGIPQTSKQNMKLLKNLIGFMGIIQHYLESNKFN